VDAFAAIAAQTIAGGASRQRREVFALHGLSARGGAEETRAQNDGAAKKIGSDGVSLRYAINPSIGRAGAWRGRAVSFPPAAAPSMRASLSSAAAASPRPPRRAAALPSWPGRGRGWPVGSARPARSRAAFPRG